LSYILKLIVIDSIQHLNILEESTKNLNSSIPKQLKSLARKLSIPIIVTSSIPIEVENRSCKRPILSDLSSCSELEEFSDTVLFIYRDEVYNEYSENTGEAEILIAKEMSGRIGRVKVNYSESNFSFRSFIKDE
jgi:replicative DNA helicase